MAGDAPGGATAAAAGAMGPAAAARHAVPIGGAVAAVVGDTGGLDAVEGAEEGHAVGRRATA